MFFPCSSTVSTSYSSQWEHHVWHQKTRNPVTKQAREFSCEILFSLLLCLFTSPQSIPWPNSQIQYKDCEIVRPSHETLKAPLLLCSKPRNKPCIFLSRPQLSLWDPENSRTNRHSACLCAVCACTHNRNQTETSGSNNSKSKDRWSGMEIRRRKRTCTSTCSSVKELGSLLLRHIESSLGPKASNSYGLEKQCNAATACCTIFSYILFFMVVFCHSPCCCWPFAYPSRTEPENAEPDCSCILVSCVRTLSLSLPPSLARVGTGPGWRKGVFPCALGTWRALWDSRWHPDAWPDPARPVPGSPFPGATK
jgi:hypothetical protein